MSTIKKRMRQAFALFFSVFIVLMPLFSPSQAFAAVCGDQTPEGNPTFCSIGFHTEPRVDLSCPFPSACYVGQNTTPTECSWSVNNGRPTYCWSFKDDGSGNATTLLNNSVLSFNCLNHSTITDCGGILAQMGIQLGGSAANQQRVVVSQLPGGTPIGDSGGGIKYTCVSMDYNQDMVKEFAKTQALKQCGAALAAIPGAIGAGGLVVSGGFLGAVGTGVVASLTAPVVFGGTIAAGTAAEAAAVSTFKTCLDNLNGTGNGLSLLDWNGSVMGPDGNTPVCSARTTLTINFNDGVTASTESQNSGKITSPFSLCNQIPDPTQKASCVKCESTDGGDEANPKAIWTAVGCIPTTSGGIVASLVKLGLGIAGTAALLMILAGAFMLSTSQGDTKRVGEARELITSAVIGLLFIVFSVTLLQFVGVSLFHLPGFGS